MNPTPTTLTCMPVVQHALQQEAQKPTQRELRVRALVQELKGKSLADLQARLGETLGAEVADAIQSQAPTPRQILWKREQMYREANAECGKALAAAGVQVHHHSVNEHTHVIVKQLDLQLEGVNPSVSEVLRAAYPDDPKKAQSIGNSRNIKRRKQAYNADAVRNHPVEKAMQATLGKSSMNRRCTTGTFGQSLDMNATLFKSSDRITKLEARVQVLEQQMACTKNREALDDAGATSSKDKVLALTREGKGPTAIAQLLDMPLNTVKSILKRSK